MWNMKSEFFSIIAFHTSLWWLFCQSSFVALFHQQSQEKKPRESILRTEFANAIEFINKDLPCESRLKFLHWDLHRHSRRLLPDCDLYLLPSLSRYCMVCKSKLTHLWANKFFCSKAKGVLTLLGKVAAYALNITGFFHCEVSPTLGCDSDIKEPIIL